MQRVLFVRTGWMTYYTGSHEGDERPAGGGKSTKTNIGHEVFNFRNVNGRLYGYFENNGSFAANPARIDPSVPGAESLDGVTVVFVARRKDYGQVIVGWYRNATVFRNLQQATEDMLRGDCRYSLTTKSRDAVLLPSINRVHKMPSGKETMERAHVFYAHDSNGSPVALPWMEESLRYIRDYDGGNLLEAPDEDFCQEVEELMEDHRAAQSGQGYKITPELRMAIEDYSVNKAIKYFESRDYSVENVGKTRSYDLHCKKNGEELRVEVKGTQSGGQSVILTPNEVKNARANLTALFILHDIRVVRKYQRNFKLSGGAAKVLHPWVIGEQGILTPVGYTYSLP